MLFRHEIADVAVNAPAKLNLFLKVLGKRSDGYHELETLMVSVDLYDTLRARRGQSEAISLACFDAGLPAGNGRVLPPADAGNLVVRAAAALRKYTGVRFGVELELYKRIPLAAGLGGGSSDAAATLLLLNRFWNLDLSRAELHQLAAGLGSDVPFFLGSASAALCRGRGEIIEPLTIRQRLHFVVVRPATGLATAEVFRHARPSNTGLTGEHMAAALRRGRLDQTVICLHNTLQEPAERLNPEVAGLRAHFARQSLAGHLMSGSGSSYFGLCRSRKQALHLAARFKAARLGDVFVTSNRP